MDTDTGQRSAPAIASGIWSVDRIAETLGASARAQNVYGDPVERDGVTVIPVAKIRYGFGGGGEVEKDEYESGGGGGISVTPVGYVELRGGTSTYRPIRGAGAMVPMVAVAGLLGLLGLRMFARLTARRAETAASP